MRKSCLLLLCLFAFAAHAEVVDNLFDVAVEVEEQGQRELARAAAEGLETVLVRVSGRQDVRDNPTVAAALSDARRYLSQYRYETVKKDSGGESRLLVHLSFIGAQVTGLLREAQLPVWSSNRPRLLVWMVVDEVDGRHFATRETDPALLESLEKHTRRRGLAVTYPLLDLQDSLNLTPDQLWTLDRDALQRAVERYNVDHYLIGRLSPLSSGAWLGSWYFASSDREYQLDAREPKAQAVARQPIDMVADRLAARYAILPSGEGVYNAYVHISGIGGFPQYARAISYLEQNAAIGHANPVWASGDAVIVDLVLKGTLEKAEQFFALDNKLVAVEPPAEPPLIGVPPRSAARDEGDDGDEEATAGGEDGGSGAVRGGIPGKTRFPQTGGTAPEAGTSAVAAAPATRAPFTNIQGYYRWQGR